jgi:hypothetical protein
MTGDAYWSCRLAPYGLVLAAVALGVSLIWVSPRFDHLGLAAASGAAVAICHSVKWRTGQLRYQLLAMAFGFVPLLVAFGSSSTGQKGQYVSALLIVYAAGLTLLARRIYKWISLNTEGAAPNDGAATPLGNSEGSGGDRHR